MEEIMFKEKYFDLKNKRSKFLIIMKNGIFYVLEICFAKIKKPNKRLKKLFTNIIICSILNTSKRVIT